MLKTVHTFRRGLVKRGDTFVPIVTETIIVNTEAITHVDPAHQDFDYGEGKSCHIKACDYVELYMPTSTYCILNADFKKAFGLPAPHRTEEEEKQ